MLCCVVLCFLFLVFFFFRFCFVSCVTVPHQKLSPTSVCEICVTAHNRVTEIDYVWICETVTSSNYRQNRLDVTHFWNLGYAFWKLLRCCVAKSYHLMLDHQQTFQHTPIHAWTAISINTNGICFILDIFMCLIW